VAQPPPASDYNKDGSSKKHGLDQVPTTYQSADAKFPPPKGKGEVHIEESKLEGFAKALEDDLKTLKTALDKVVNNGAAPGHNVGVKGDPADTFGQMLTDQHNVFVTKFANLQKSYQDVAKGLRTALKTSKQAGVDSTPTYTPPTYTPTNYTPPSYQ
jgi:hypothetical protein